MFKTIQKSVAELVVGDFVKNYGPVLEMKKSHKGRFDITFQGVSLNMHGSIDFLVFVKI
jgi:hypothetical protein